MPIYEKLTKQQANRLEQRTLKVSVATIVVLAFTAFAYGLYVESEVIMLDGVCLAFSAVTAVGFAIVFVLPEPWRSVWARYADSALVSLMALLLLPVPWRILKHNVREVLMITSTDEVLVGRVEGVLQQIRAEHDVLSHSSHIVKIGRMHFIEVNIVVGPGFAPQRVSELDQLRERIGSAVGRPLDEAWLSVCFTADPRWS